MDPEFNFDKPVCRKGTNCIKWDRSRGKFQEEDLLPLWIADTDFNCPQEVTQAINDRCSHPIFGYSFPSEDYYTSIINWFGRRHGLTLQKSWIRACCGVVTSISYSIQALTKPGDKVLIQTPVYDPFQAVIESTGRRVTENPLIYTGNTYQIDFEGLEEELKGGVRLMVFCNPHNPVGRVWTQDEVSRVVFLCRRYHVYLVSDEIHCDIELFNNRYTSVLSIPESHPIAVSCVAPGKTFNISGLGVSGMLIPNQEIHDKIFSKLRSAWLLNPSVLSMEASAAAYTHGFNWLDAQLDYIEGNARLVFERLAASAPNIKPSVLEGTFLMWLDFNSFNMNDDSLHQELIHTWHLGLNDGNHYGTGGYGFMRMNIGCSKELLSQALDRLIQMHEAHFPSLERS